MARLRAEPSTRWFGSGRQALCALLGALKDRGAKSAWLPEYHCVSMISACQRAGLAVRFYEVDEGLTPRVDTLEDLCAQDTVVGVHYFGRPFDLGPLAKLAAVRGATLIEDAAHVPFASTNVSPIIGARGAFVLYCPRKFARVYDGAVLRGEEAVLASLVQRTPSLREQLKGFAAWFERPGFARAYAQRQDEPSLAGWVEPRFDVTLLQRATLASRVMHRVAALRRSRHTVRLERYKALDRAARSGSVMRPLFPDLPCGTVPYVFPAVLANPDDFARLRALGINALRWEVLAGNPSSAVSALRWRLVQLPVAETMSERNFRTLLSHVQGTRV